MVSLTAGEAWILPLMALAGLLGLCIGSFLNVVIWRVPNGVSLVAPPSSCPTCDTPIKWYDNVPVISWALLGAKCRSCRAHISGRYPLVELLTGAVLLAIAWKFVSGANSLEMVVGALPFLYLGALGVALGFIDLDTHKLPNRLVLPAYPIMFGLIALATVVSGAGWATVGRAVLAAGALYAFYFVLCIVGGMGFGDVKLAGVLGMSLGWLGWDYLIVGGFLPFLIGGAFSAWLLLTRRAGRKSGIPFGPWMILGWFVALFVSEPIADWYLSFLL